MNWELERGSLLPRSGVGVVSNWLVIAPPGNPVIRIDLRALDEIWHAERNESEDNDAEDDGASADADAGRSLEDSRCTLMLVIGELWVGLYVADGPDAVDSIVRDATPHTREATGSASPADRSEMLIVGNDAVVQLDDCIQVGSIKFRIGEVREYALRGANLSLPGGRLLQAAMALLVVAAGERDSPASA